MSEVNILTAPGLKLKDILIWMQSLPVDYLEYELVAAHNGKVSIPGLSTPQHLYQKEYNIRAFDIDERSKQVLFLHVIDDANQNKIITNI